MSKYNEEFKVTIEERLFSFSETLVMEVCCACDSKFITTIPLDPGHHYYQVETATLCFECSDKSYKGEIPLYIYSEREEVDAYRKSIGLLPYSESLNKFYLETSYEEEMRNKEAFSTEDEDYPSEGGDAPPNEVYPIEVNPFDEDYYDPHRDLMIERYKELGGSYY